jgi:uncharacterized protein (UPF0332 family)
MIDGLFELACKLAAEPDITSQRRAISTAYYAAFHAVCEMIADTLLADRTSTIYKKIYRHIDHGIFGNEKAFKLGDSDPETFDKIRSILKNLKEKRHAADYDPVSADNFDANTAIIQSREVIGLIRSIESDAARDLALNILVGGGRNPSPTDRQKKQKSAVT